MSWFDWIIAIVPVCVVMWFGFHSRKYVTGVSDFMAAGRVCRRYVLTTASMADALGLVTLIAFIEMRYSTGFAITFWNNLTLPLGLILTLSGYCLYRFRETRALSIGQFLEMRYNRSLRIFASFLRSLAEILANTIMPAIAARFFITYLGLPHTFDLFGWQCPTFSVIMLVTLVLAITLICCAGQLSITITDTLQGLIFFPSMLIFIVFVWCRFSWSEEIVTVMSDHVPGESFLDPFDIRNVRNFNIFMLITTFLGMLLHRASGIAGEHSASINAHEGKMGAILGTWRSAFILIFMVILSLTLITVLHHENYADDAKAIRTEISRKAAEELVDNPEEMTSLMKAVDAIPAIRHKAGVDAPYSAKNTPDRIYFDTAQKEFGLDGHGSSKTQQFKTLFRQLLLPATMRHILPPGLVGLFCMLILLFILSTDDSRIFSASSTIVQDCIVPFYRNGELSPQRHVFYIRLISICVGIVFFFGSFYMSQLDFINLFVQIMYGMWLGGCGPMMVFGFYSRFGTSQGAWSSLLSGMGFTVAGIFLQRGWTETIYPWLERNSLVESVQKILSSVSSPFYPYIDWTVVDRLKCPINSYEFYFMSMIISLIVYVTVSKLTCRKPFNLERMLHRGKYAITGDEVKPAPKLTVRSIFSRLLGITPEYSKGDRIIAWSVFLYTFVYKFLFFFVAVAIWNLISPWPKAWWGNYFFITFLLVPGIAALVTSVWFTIGSSLDMYRMFRDLKIRVSNPLDNGMVEGHVAVSEREQMESIEKK